MPGVSQQWVRVIAIVLLVVAAIWGIYWVVR
jgi:hypothetical protein